MANAKLVKLDDGTYVLGYHMTAEEAQAMRDAIGASSSQSIGESVSDGKRLVDKLGKRKYELFYATYVSAFNPLKKEFERGWGG